MKEEQGKIELYNKGTSYGMHRVNDKEFNLILDLCEQLDNQHPKQRGKVIKVAVTVTTEYDLKEQP